MSRIVSSNESYSGKGNKKIIFNVFQTRISVTAYDGPIKFKYRTYRDLYETFDLKPGEHFHENTEPIRELEIIAEPNHRWSFNGFINLDGGGPYHIQTYDEFK